MIHVTNATEFLGGEFPRRVLASADFQQRRLRPLKIKARRLLLRELIRDHDVVIAVTHRAQGEYRVRYTFHVIAGRQVLWLDRIGYQKESYSLAAIWAAEDEEVAALRELAAEAHVAAGKPARGLFE